VSGIVAAVMADDEDVVIEHPNRRKASSKVARLLVILLLLLSAFVLTLIAVGGWSTIDGAKPIQIAFIVLDLLMAFFVLRWSRGVLPMIAGVATFVGIFGAVAAPDWFARDKAGFTDPALGSGVIGLLCALLVPLQLLLIFVSLQAFRQAWNVEAERTRPERREPDPEPAPA
jgi:hypothetical protein